MALNRTFRRLRSLGILGIAVALTIAVDAGPAAAAGKESKVERDIILDRATTAMYWGMPAVAMVAAWHAMERDIGARPLDIQCLSHSIKAHHAMLTGNSVSAYCLIMLDLRHGPAVLELPPASPGALLVGTANDSWQEPIVDFGPRGADGGRGAKFLFLSPDFGGAIPDGYVAEKSKTYRVMLVLRPVAINGASMADAIAYAHSMKTYLLADEARPPPTKFIDWSQMRIDALPHYDWRFFRDLDEAIQTEPLQTRDAAMVGTLARLGIEKGKPFAPDASMKQLFDEAAQIGHKMLQHDFVTPGRAMVPFWPGSQWSRLNIPESQMAAGFPFFKDGRVLIDERADYFFWIFGTFKHYAIPPAVYYLTTLRDRTGALLDGDARYHLHVPADAPVGQFWAVTVYDRTTKSFISTAARSGLSSYDHLRVNPDRSIDLYFGGTPPKGMESNWLPTGEPFFVTFRLYGVEPSFFEGAWRLPDLNRD